MSSRRPTLIATNEPRLNYEATYFRVFEATSGVQGLLHGKLRDNGNTCAIGCYFAKAKIPIDSKACDEIASYNDSFPQLSRYERWKKVRRWLKFQIKVLENKKGG